MIFRHTFTVPGDTIDRNGHVNNVAYIQWMQDVAIRHSESTGASQVMREAGGSWVVRAHQIEYLKPAFEGESIVAVTWVASFQRVKCVRRYEFVRQEDNALLARGETCWVFIDTQTGRPRKIPESLIRLLPIAESGND